MDENKPNGAVKFDNGKPSLAQGVLWRFPRALEAVAGVSHIGCTKYACPKDDTNFLQVEDGFNRYSDALIRHFQKEKTDGMESIEVGGFLPPEGLRTTHPAQVAWNALARLEIYLKGLEDEKASN